MAARTTRSTVASRAPARRSAPTMRPVTISRWRLNVLLLLAVVIIARIAVHLGSIQTGQVRVGERTLAEMARAEVRQRLPIPAPRGVIRDSKGNVLALDVDLQSLYVVPSQIDQKNAPRLALTLSGLIGVPSPDILAAMQNTSLYQVRIKRWLEPAIAERVLALDESGLILEYEPRRVYPQGSLAAHVIGAVNFEHTGISGVEGYYDTLLRGSTGVITAEVDSQRNPIWIAPQEMQPASPGVDLQLTIDPTVQHIIETELKKAVDAHNADGGVVIVMDPRTGAILGMASYPTFDPNRYFEYPPEMYNLNPAVGTQYEPGSTFKIFTVAAGLQTRAFTADTVVDDPGSVYRYGWRLSNWNGAGNGPVNPEKVLYYSSNVGALQLAELIGADRFYAMLDAFGFGRPTGIDIAGEATGMVQTPARAGWSPLVLDTNGYGQGIAVTPLQLVRMMAAVGNDGKLMRPYIVERRCRGDDCVITQPKQIGQPIEPGVAWTVRRMLVKSANHYAPVVWAGMTGNYGDAWLVPGYEVCAKTGTSSIPDGRGGYVSDATIGSVVGLAPAEDARFAILVKVDRPRDDYWAVRTAIPLFQSIATQLVQYARIAPDMDLVDPGQTVGGRLNR
ncbi:peptidoglycan D,D-transpeptidase FtsI family protein [Roseiflexus sp.]|uniref:peptidoglycan D,D-transpeptidase FtsI family protein n=1 Tax=Roseiflexus sp. TaxID=2562120 RepID=UPI00398B3069